MQNTFTLRVVWEFVCVFLCVCVLTNLLHVSHLHCCRPFAAPLLDSSPSRPNFFLLLFFFFSPLFSSALSQSLVYCLLCLSLFGYRLPPGQKLYSSLCLPVRLHRRSPSSIFPLYPLPFIPFFFHLFSPSQQKVLGPIYWNFPFALLASQ